MGASSSTFQRNGGKANLFIASDLKTTFEETYFADHTHLNVTRKRPAIFPSTIYSATMQVGILLTRAAKINTQPPDVQLSAGDQI